MIIHLPPEIENSIQAAVHSGHFASVDAAMTKAASLLLQQLKQEQAAAAAHQVEAVPAHKPIWEVFQQLSADVPDEVWDSCRLTYPSSMTITSTERLSGQSNEAGFCRFPLLDRPFPPARPMACCRSHVEPVPPTHRDRHHR